MGVRCVHGCEVCSYAESYGLGTQFERTLRVPFCLLASLAFSLGRCYLAPRASRVSVEVLGCVEVLVSVRVC